MPTVGEKCEFCQRVHVIKPMSILETLTPKQRIKTFKAEPNHRLFIDGYCCSLIMDNEVWEFYEPLKIWKLSLEKEEGKKEEPERKQRPFYGNTEYEEEQLLDEDNYEDW